MAARKKKRELSEKAQKRIRQRNLHVGITVIAAIVIIFSVIQFTLWRYVSKVDEEYICKNVFIGKTDVSGMTKEEAVKAVNNTLGDYRNKQLVLKVKDQGADMSIEEMGAEVENIDKLAEKAVGYGKNGSIWSRYQKIHNLDKKKYVIDESFKVDEAKLRELIQERAVPLEQKAVNASASYNGSGFDLTDEAEGYTVDVDKSVKKIKNFMNKKWNYEDAEVELKLDMEKPTIKKADLESLQDELGSYTTNAGWGDRVQNIRRATELINGTVVMPGEEFSVEQATLPYTEENGYVAGSAYENGQIVESIGGGLCQVSTTLYNAVLYAELEVTRRAPHSMSVSYVEPSRDAMIAEGISDFKFVNNYDTPILIEGYIDGHNIDFVKNKVAFDLEWNSKDQTFDRDLLSMRTYFDCGLISVGIIVTRAEELNDIFKVVNDDTGKSLIKKYGASTTWMGKLIYRLESRRNGGCPILAIGIKKACIEDI